MKENHRVSFSSNFITPRMGDNLHPIRLLIANAQASDASSGRLQQFVRVRRDKLHTAIKLPEAEASALLVDFVLRYIQHVPDFIEAIRDLTQEAGIYREVRPLLKIASDYFLSPPSIVHHTCELEALLDEAYLAHRLLEEINDRFMASHGIPLAPMDMTLANIVAHELIGEPFANELDQAVLFSAELLLNEYRLDGAKLDDYVAIHKDRGWQDELKRWPCLIENLAFAVEFKGDQELQH
jgi:hypothetical protein